MRNALRRSLVGCWVNVILGLLVPSLSLGVPLGLPSDIPSEVVHTALTGQQAPGYNNLVFQWTTGYEIGFSDSTFNVDLRILLVDPGGAQVPHSPMTDMWETAIEMIWSGRFEILKDDIFKYDVSVTASFTDADPTDFVTLYPGVPSGNAGDPVFDMTHWFTGGRVAGDPQIPEAVTHEVGHMLGNFDEYPTGATNGVIFDVPDSIMGSGLTRTVYPRYYNFILDWVEPKFPTQTFAVVPWPPAALLLILGLAAAAASSRRSDGPPRRGPRERRR